MSISAETRTRRKNPYEQIWSSVVAQTKDHQLTILREDGLHRHLTVAEPGVNNWSWGVITWPGHLATFGDIADGYMFRRTRDMLTFFDVDDHLLDYYTDGSPSIDFRYWAEKLCGGRDVTRYDPDTFMWQVKEALAEDELDDEAQAELIEEASWVQASEGTAREWLNNREAVFGTDTWEWDLTDFDTSFLFACYCIHLTVRLYREDQA